MIKGSERNYTLKIFEDIAKKEIFANQVIDDYFYLYDFDKQQKSFISKLVYGTIENIKYIDFCLNQVSKIKVNKMKPVIRHILRMSVYQLLFMDKVPSHAAINEAVKLVEMRKLFQLKGFVNGVLRSVERKKDTFAEILSKLPIQERLSTQYSINMDVTGYLLKQYTSDELENFLQQSLIQKETCIRTNLLKIDSIALTKKISKQAIIKKGHLLKDSMYISDYDAMNKIDSFNRGEFQVQDESSTLVGFVADPKADDVVIDVCAAPGGKSTHIAQLLNGKGKVLACDISEAKLTRINENINRLGLINIDSIICDATTFVPDYKNQFDIVLADVPCSGLGLLRTKPDIKTNMTVDKIKSLIPLQQEILQNVSLYVKPGGTLIYSTCTINKKENRAQVNEFLEANKEFYLETITSDKFVHGLMDGYQFDNHIIDGCIELITDSQLTDGFFIAKLKRKEV